MTVFHSEDNKKLIIFFLRKTGSDAHDGIENIDLLAVLVCEESAIPSRGCVYIHTASVYKDR